MFLKLPIGLDSTTCLISPNVLKKFTVPHLHNLVNPGGKKGISNSVYCDVTTVLGMVTRLASVALVVL